MHALHHPQLKLPHAVTLLAALLAVGLTLVLLTAFGSVFPGGGGSGTAAPALLTHGQGAAAPSAVAPVWAHGPFASILTKPAVFGSTGRG